ncbi:MAG: Rare lipoprotein A precursor [uncultured Acetobacteraceae bacterium]|uniref:Endolytic peptidoglycan transglycosylase RlpA n=1 Tax=uncultured Acetobacteraceae bacterium TaxID=169975 RepID=A0A6J4IE74_9PROT|nr:MAG: Rare lipoprotein A precursor [uncultured Acetobacteraceae bacterium]
MVLGLGLAACDRSPIAQAEAAPKQQSQQQSQQQQRPSQEGEASYYGSQFNGRQMANGERFNPNSNSAAHRSLPLGTTAQVTNLANGRSVTVKVEDRGPYARNRVIDLSPRNAEELGIKQAGHAPVRVTPIEVPEGSARPSGRDEGRQSRR